MSEVKHNSNAPEVGQTIAGKYRVEGMLGSGGMGVVFSARHLDLDRLVAVKVMRPELAQDSGAVQRLVLEAKLAAQFRSEHVCHVMDVGTLEGGTPYVVMEYLEGEDLNELLARQGALDVTDSVDFVLQACEALAEAHAANVVHRDLKPENLFVTKALDGGAQIKVLDFGISKQLGNTSSLALTNPSAALGSPYYMAPEQMRAARDVDCRADIWAMGAILFELVTNRRAFDGDTLPEVCSAVLAAPPRRADELDPSVPQALANAIARCLEKNPAQRFSSVLALGEALVPFGSARAQLSLKRIRRVLSAHAGTMPSIAPDSPLRAMPVRVSSMPLRAQPPTPTLTTGAAGALVAEARSRRLPWLAALLALFVLVASAATIAARQEAARAAASTAAVLPPSAAPVQAVAIEAASAPAAAPVVSAATALAEPLAPPATATPLVTAGRAPRTPRTAQRSRPAPSASSVSAASVTASPPARLAKSSTDAWNMDSFGPRK